MTDENSELLASRYGQGSRISKRSQRVLASLGIAAITAIALWFGYANYQGLEHKDISFKVNDAKSVTLTFDLTKPKDSSAICSLQALNEQFGVVGYKSIEIKPQDTQTVRMAVTINTIEPATTALVDNCKLK